MRDLTAKEYLNFLKKINEIYGYDFTEYSETSFRRRLDRFMINQNLKNFEELEKKIYSSRNFFSIFLENITVNVTEMFRDPSFYKSLVDKVFPELATFPFIKIWVAGCSTGEEMYSIAILLKEYGLLEKSTIYGTDINPKVLKQAKTGIFPLRFMKDYTINYQATGVKGDFSSYYTAQYDEVIFASYLSKKMVFAQHNLVTDQKFNEFHLILCRNVMIYFNKNLQAKVIKNFIDSLTSFGYLGIGIKEKIFVAYQKINVKEIDATNKIYQKIS